jgi:hypothetical protein
MNYAELRGILKSKVERHNLLLITNWTRGIKYLLSLSLSRDRLRFIRGKQLGGTKLSLSSDSEVDTIILLWSW